MGRQHKESVCSTCGQALYVGHVCWVGLLCKALRRVILVSVQKLCSFFTGFCSLLSPAYAKVTKYISA